MTTKLEVSIKKFEEEFYTTTVFGFVKCRKGRIESLLNNVKEFIEEAITVNIWADNVIDKLREENTRECLDYRHEIESLHTRYANTIEDLHQQIRDLKKS